MSVIPHSFSLSQSFIIFRVHQFWSYAIRTKQSKRKQKDMGSNQKWNNNNNTQKTQWFLLEKFQIFQKRRIRSNSSNNEKKISVLIENRYSRLFFRGHCLSYPFQWDQVNALFASLAELSMNQTNSKPWWSVRCNSHAPKFY